MSTEAAIKTDRPPHVEVDEGGWIIQRWFKTGKGAWRLSKETFCKSRKGYERALKAAKAWRFHHIVVYRANAGYSNIGWDIIEERHGQLSTR